MESDLIAGARLRMVNSIHPGMVIEVRRVTVTSVQYEYVKSQNGKRVKAEKRITHPIDWIISHTEVV